MNRHVAMPAAALIAAILSYETVVKPWQQRWGATSRELDEYLPGDELVTEPATQVTRAITIPASPEQVWPWVVQIGADRGGFYSYDWLENLFGLGIHSAAEIVPDWQRRAVDDLVLANRTGTGGWYVVALQESEALVLKLANPSQGRPARRDEGLKWEFLWTFALRRADLGGARLLVRERVAFDSRLSRLLMAPIGLVSFVMTRKMMLGIKWRAETATGAAARRDADHRPRPSAPPGPRNGDP
jgi:hypothetical protein